MSSWTSWRRPVAALSLLVSAPWAQAVDLVPVATGALESPVFVGHAGDGTRRLFIVEQGGRIRVLQPGATAATVFLDIRSRLAISNEQGLLGLAFHPGYAGNGRFFVYYTRAGDGAIVLAQYRVSAADPNVADTAETPLLTIAHPVNTNHNGGMIAFGPDGFLYAGVGDGGSGNDPPGNAQNKDVLLGKIVRIDVDRPDPVAGTPYSSPADNPYVGTGGRDEIFSIGWRNPWRFSFDRQTGQQWVADVGQNAHEEVNSPVVNGGNYGWRTYEGNACTGLDPGLCVPQNFVFPAFQYDHVNGRCAVTGGYVYRGTQGALPAGTYVYGDFCTGEILAWNGSSQRVLVDTALNIASFGEDEDGELYVVGIGGSVSRLAPSGTCSYTLTPETATAGAGGGTGSLAVATGAGCGWTAQSAASWLRVTGGATGTGNGTVTYRVASNSGTSPRTASIAIADKRFTLTQDGTTCSVRVSPQRASFGGTGGTGSVTVAAATGCPWSGSSSQPWITITSGGSGSGDGTLGYAVEPFNGPGRSRTGTLTIGGDTVSIRQTR